MKGSVHFLVNISNYYTISLQNQLVAPYTILIVKRLK